MVIDDLIEIAEKERASRKKHVVRCCMAAGCMSSNSKGVKESLDKAVKEAGLQEEVEVRGVGCMKLCCQGPLVQIDTLPDGEGATVRIDSPRQSPLYQKVTPEDAASVIATLTGGKTQVQTGDPNQPFFTDQMSIVLANSGQVDPERVESYIAVEGYQALHDVLREMTPKDVVDTLIKSGLRGRGGAGYPTGLKWATVAKTVSTHKYVICNADEGDPGAFMDRSVLESDPHSVLEGMAIAAYAVGANQGFIYVRAEYPLAISRLQTAIKQAKQLGLLGSGIFESPFNFNVDLRIGAGAFVCGEETALMASVEGKRGTPRPAPAVPGRERALEQPHADQQRRDVRQRAGHPAQRRGVVRGHRHREEQGHQGVRPRGQDHQYRPHRGPHGDTFAAHRRENGRRRARRRPHQGRADGRPLGGLHPRRGARHAG